METPMLKEWAPKDFSPVQQSIKKWIKSRFFETHHTPNKNPFTTFRTFKQISEVLGLAYTSSGKFAGYWICNTSLYLDDEKKYQIEGFCQSAGGFLYAYCTDKNENELYIPIN